MLEVCRPGCVEKLAGGARLLYIYIYFSDFLEVGGCHRWLRGSSGVWVIFLEPS